MNPWYVDITIERMNAPIVKTDTKIVGRTWDVKSALVVPELYSAITLSSAIEDTVRIAILISAMIIEKVIQNIFDDFAFLFKSLLIFLTKEPVDLYSSFRLLLILLMNLLYNKFMKTLFIYTSPTTESEKGSTSARAADIFKKEYLERTGDEAIILDLNNEEVGTKSLTSANFSSFFSDGISDKHIDLLKSVDKLVISSPMINFNYPAVLKNYLDHVLVANKTFKYKYNGKGASEGLLTNIKSAQLILTQGAPTGWYGFASHAESLKGALEFVGIKVQKPLLLDGTKAPEEINKSVEEFLEQHLSKISKAAKEF